MEIALFLISILSLYYLFLSFFYIRKGTSERIVLSCILFALYSVESILRILLGEISFLTIILAILWGINSVSNIKYAIKLSKLKKQLNNESDKNSKNSENNKEDNN